MFKQGIDVIRIESTRFSHYHYILVQVTLLDPVMNIPKVVEEQKYTWLANDEKLNKEEIIYTYSTRGHLRFLTAHPCDAPTLTSPMN